MTPTAYLNMEKRFNFLNITISKDDNNIMFIIYRKPTATDIIIQKDSCSLPPRAQTGSNYTPN